MAAAGLDAGAGSFSVGGVIGRTFQVWGRNAWAFSAVSLVLQAPVLVADAVMGAPRIGEAGDAALIRQGMGLVGVVLGFAAAGALTYGVLQSLRGAKVRLGELLAVGFRNMGRILVVSFGVGFFSGLAALLLFVPGIVVFTMLCVAVPAAVAEPGIGHGDALRRSRALTKGHRPAVFLVMAVFYLLLMVVGVPLSTAATFVPALQGGPAFVLSQALLALLGSLFSTSQAVTYHDLRVAKEGVATEDLAAVFD